MNRSIEQLPKWKKVFENYFERYSDLVDNMASQMESLKYTYNQMVNLNSDFQDRIRKLGELRSMIDLERVEKLLSKQAAYFGGQSKEMEKGIAHLKERFHSILKY